MRQHYHTPSIIQTAHIRLETDILTGSEIFFNAVIESAGQEYREFDFTSADTPFKITWEEL